jgi:5-(carboxyamino)imidazole ribonucleotide mutase
MTKPFVAILMGSDSDLTTMETTFKELKALDIPFEANVLSAHRTPDLTADYVADADQRGCAVFIAAAGLAAHLAGAVAAHTIKPVIGVPLDAGGLGGLDALLSTVQMPGGVPVACTAVGKAGAKNAAILAAQILALHDAGIAKKLQQQRSNKRKSLQQANADLKVSCKN